MVKNTGGGNKHKSMARKNANAVQSNQLILPQEEGECFAKVTKLLGNGMCHVTLLHDNQIIENVICHIRGKFRSRNKRHNTVSTDSFLIVGLRTWSSDNNHCDLIHIFDNSHINLLSNYSSFHLLHSYYLQQLQQPLDDIFHNTSHNSHTTTHSTTHQHHLDHHHLDLDLDFI